MTVKVLDASHLNEFEGYDRKVCQCHIENCGYILVDTMFGDPVDDEFMLYEAYSQLGKPNQMARG